MGEEVGRVTLSVDGDGFAVGVVAIGREDILHWVGGGGTSRYAIGGTTYEVTAPTLAEATIKRRGRKVRKVASEAGEEGQRMLDEATEHHRAWAAQLDERRDAYHKAGGQVFGLAVMFDTCFGGR